MMSHIPPPDDHHFGQGNHSTNNQSNNTSSLFAGVDAMPKRLDFQYEQELSEKRAQQEDEAKKEHMDAMDDFFHRPWAEAHKVPHYFVYHIIAAFVICISLFVGAGVFQWWIYPWFIFAMSLSGHYYYTKANYWTGTVVILSIFQVACYFLNQELTPAVLMVQYFDWFWYPLIISLLVGIVFYYKFDPKSSLLTTAAYAYLLVSLLVIISWLNFRWWTTFGWFVYPIAGLAAPLCVWYLHEVYRERRLWVYALVVLVFVNMMALFTWSFVYPVSPAFDWPWPLAAMLVSAFVVGGLYLYHRQSSDAPLFAGGDANSYGRTANVDLEDPIAEEYDFDG